ncbi:IS66 family insertion sequence element accessory protein TnpB [Sorangium sp. So ce1024]|uniref:IS66 family insertion sequence element accessory protein TnpB n=1 Tax=Sorangium sp. So ce1024 TaxID=3133327 RepID=UPI003F04BE09
MIPGRVSIYVATEPPDLRRSFDGLAAVVREVLREDPLSGALFLFFNRAANRCKALWWDRSGYCLERWGLHLSRSTLCGWVESCANKLAPVVGAMAKDALNAHCIAIDATGVLVQAKEKCRRGHFWVLVADRDHVLFRFTPHHNQDGPKEFLRGYKGYVQADASSVYEQLFRTEEVTEVGCWAHCRRKFFEAMTSDRDRATVAIGFIRKLYAIDKATKELPPSRRTEQRRKDAEPVLMSRRYGRSLAARRARRSSALARWCRAFCAPLLDAGPSAFRRRIGRGRGIGGTRLRRRAPAGDLHAGGDVGVDCPFPRLLLRPAPRRRRPLLLSHRVGNLRRRRAPREDGVYRTDTNRQA